MFLKTNQFYLGYLLLLSEHFLSAKTMDSCLMRLKKQCMPADQSYIDSCFVSVIMSLACRLSNNKNVIGRGRGCHCLI